MKNNLVLIGRDIGKAALLSVAGGAVVSGIGLLSGLFYQKTRLLNGLQNTQRIFLVVGALGLFITSGFILSVKSRAKLEEKEGWERQFKILKPHHIIALFSTIFLLFAGLIDYLIIFMGR